MAFRSARPELGVERLDTGVSIRDQAYAALKRAIASADIYSRPDEIRIDERALCQQLGVSRTPVREAMTLLEQEGFLRTEPRRGIFIIRKTRRQIVEMIQVWAALEGMTARLATKRASDREIAALRDIFGDFADANPAEKIDEYSDANIAFHQALIKLGGSDLIVSMTDNLFLHVRSVRRVTIAHGDRAERSLADHLKIIEALAKRNAERAEKLSREQALSLADHVEKFCDFLD
ncbi:MAG TPA: GntR family transcriptional regulator [Stellaceae bacterium]|jgi:DNA-binding GntR family transcriptional regulator|nr:GntR family transcriptional regulator [Stellaceae bacterium]